MAKQGYRSKSASSPPRAAGRAVSPGLLIAGAAALVVTAFYVGARVPIGVPSEWTTAYRQGIPPVAELMPQAAWFLAAAGVFLAIAFFAQRAVGRSASKLAGSRPRRAAVVAALTVAYALALFAAASIGPLGRGEFAAPLFKHDAAGLFARESEKVADVNLYLQTLPERLRSYTADYRATVRVNNNPPGTTLLLLAATRTAKASPALARAATGAVFGGDFVPENTDFAGRVLGAWLLLIGAALAFIPAYLSATALAGRPSPLVAAVAMLSGSLVLFIPGNDTFQLFFFLWMLYFFLARRTSARPWLWGAAFGLAASAGFFFSLATAVVVLTLLAANAAEWFLVLAPPAPRGATAPPRGAVLRRDAAFWAASALALAAAFACQYALQGYNALAVLRASYSNHDAFYAYFPRTYWKWLLFNPLEFALFLGGPLAVAVAFSLRRRRGCGDPGVNAAMPAGLKGYVLAVLGVIAILGLSGQNSSEVNRLWLFFMPLAALPALALISICGGGNSAVGGRGRAGGSEGIGADAFGAGDLLAIGILQTLVILILRTQVDVWRNYDFLTQLKEYGL